MQLTFDEVMDILDDIADSFPPVFYEELHGAVLLLPDLRHHPGEPDLLILGCYCRDQMGRRIEIYYDSMAELAEIENWSRSRWERKLRETLSHEFTHHLESLSGERGLEIKDAEYLARYRAERDEDEP